MNRQLVVVAFLSAISLLFVNCQQFPAQQHQQQQIPAQQHQIGGVQNNKFMDSLKPVVNPQAPLAKHAQPINNIVNRASASQGSYQWVDPPTGNDRNKKDYFDQNSYQNYQNYNPLINLQYPYNQQYMNNPWRPNFYGQQNYNQGGYPGYNMGFGYGQGQYGQGLNGQGISPFGQGSCISSPCFHMGECRQDTNGFNTYTCICPFSYYGTRCEFRNVDQIVGVVLGTIIPFFVIVAIVVTVVVCCCQRKKREMNRAR